MGHEGHAPSELGQRGVSRRHVLQHEVRRSGQVAPGPGPSADPNVGARVLVAHQGPGESGVPSESVMEADDVARYGLELILGDAVATDHQGGVGSTKEDAQVGTALGATEEEGGENGAHVDTSAEQRQV